MHRTIERDEWVGENNETKSERAPIVENGTRTVQNARHIAHTAHLRPLLTRGEPAVSHLRIFHVI